MNGIHGRISDKDIGKGKKGSGKRREGKRR
jgi:hypothetical protein